MRKQKKELQIKQKNGLVKTAEVIVTYKLGKEEKNIDISTVIGKDSTGFNEKFEVYKGTNMSAKQVNSLISTVAVSNQQSLSKGSSDFVGCVFPTSSTEDHSGFVAILVDDVDNVITYESGNCPLSGTGDSSGNYNENRGLAKGDFSGPTKCFYSTAHELANNNEHGYALEVSENNVYDVEIEYKNGLVNMIYVFTNLTEIAEFNEKFEAYKGTNISATQVNELINTVIASNQQALDNDSSIYVGCVFPTSSTEDNSGFVAILVDDVDNVITYESGSCPLSGTGDSSGNYNENRDLAKGDFSGPTKCYYSTAHELANNNEHGYALEVSENNVYDVEIEYNNERVSMIYIFTVLE